ncbi:MAG: Undecaprenyl-phosphate 4-deoxy-4-formamido-L-arabinose transferase [Verrucomicrobiae bacterium]|nr:Undecaprenyl-phosphate 4-deoxy-4-formamido-L-arabinose transferase [Verrucomicrobiae bacterium]
MTISVIIPALNEQGNIAGAVTEVLEALGDRFAQYEVILVDDGSTDDTGKIMDQIAASNPHLKVIHNLQPSNFGGAYKKGLAAAAMEYVVMIPGDNQFPSSSIVKVLERIGKADIVVPYTSNQQIRTRGRRIGSQVFTRLLNFLFRLRLRYYNGIVVHRTHLVKSITITTDGFAYQAEALIKLLRAGHSYIEVATEITERATGRSAALRPKNLILVMQTIRHLIGEIYFP